MSQIVSKFLATGAVAKLLNNTYMVGRNAANTGDVNLIKVNASDKLELSAGAQVSGTPSSANDIVNKSYADSVSGTGANTALSNLASVAINAALIPGTTATLDFGSSTKTWVAGFFASIKDVSNVVALDVTARLLKNTSGTTLIDFSGTNAQTSVAPSAGNDIANKTYVDSVASAQKTWGYEALTLNGTDITNQYKDLAQVAITDSIEFFVNGIWQRPVTDYTISYTGGTGGKTRLSFAGDLATGGAAALVSTDVINIRYQY